jgi:transcriptional regulator with XRE-family HTH domain
LSYAVIDVIHLNHRGTFVSRRISGRLLHDQVTFLCVTLLCEEDWRMPKSAVVSAWELGLRLREHRDQLALSVAAVAKAVKMQQPNLSAVESGRKKLTAANLAKLTKLYELEAAELAELKELQAEAEHRDWYHRYAWLFGDDFVRYLGLETGAECLRVYEGSLVPGPLQTSDYAKAVIRGAAPYVRLTELEPRTEVRLARQNRLSGDNPLRLRVVIAEAALRQQVGGPGVMRKQLAHLVEVIQEQPHVDIKVIPFSVGSHPALGGMFHILSFESARLPDLVWQETLTSTATIDGKTQVREYNVAFAETAAKALDTQATLELIQSVVKEMT